MRVCGMAKQETVAERGEGDPVDDGGMRDGHLQFGGQPVGVGAEIGVGGVRGIDVPGHEFGEGDMGFGPGVPGFHAGPGDVYKC